MIVIILLCGHSASRADSFGTLDVGSCFSDILVDKQINKSDVNVRYALQQQWSRDLYEQAKRSETLGLWIDGATAQDTYETTNNKRLQEMYKMSLDYTYSSNSAAYSAKLNPQAKDIITKCLDALGAKRGTGLYWVPFVHSDDPTLVDLELRFQYHPVNKALLRISTKQIENAEVQDDGGSHPTELFARSWSWSYQKLVDYDVLVPYESRFVRLKRKSPADTITVYITTDPNLSVPPIVISPEPNPQTCGPVSVNADQANHPLHVEVTDLQTDNAAYRILNGGQPQREGGGQSFNIQQNLTALYPPTTDFSTARITNVVCSRYGSPVDYMDWTYDVTKFPASTCCYPAINGTWDGFTATCRGWWEKPGRLIKMAIDWQRTAFQCTSRDWKLENGKWH